MRARQAAPQERVGGSGGRGNARDAAHAPAGTLPMSEDPNAARLSTSGLKRDVGICQPLRGFGEAWDPVRSGTQNNRSSPMIPTGTARYDGPMPICERKCRPRPREFCDDDPGARRMMVGFANEEPRCVRRALRRHRLATPHSALPLHPSGTRDRRSLGGPEARAEVDPVL